MSTKGIYINLTDDPMYYINKFKLGTIDNRKLKLSESDFEEHHTRIFTKSALLDEIYGDFHEEMLKFKVRSQKKAFDISFTHFDILPPEMISHIRSFIKEPDGFLTVSEYLIISFIFYMNYIFLSFLSLSSVLFVLDDSTASYVL